MRRIIFTSLLFVLIAVNMFSQTTIIGIWKNVDDEDGKEKSHINIYEEGGMLRAKVIKLLPAATLKVCSKCKGDKANKPIEGMEIIWGLKKESPSKYSGGEILNPKTGKIYSCTVTLVEPDKINVLGFLGLSFIGKTQSWYRVK